MATAAQITANRINAQASTGPVSVPGKTVSSQNALRHGLSAREVVLSTEDPAAFEQLRDSLLAEYAPASLLETSLLHQLAQTLWRLNRAQRLEHDILEREFVERDPDAPPRP